MKFVYKEQNLTGYYVIITIKITKTHQSVIDI